MDINIESGTHRSCGAFKGVHLSQVHQPIKKCTNREGVPSARLVQLRQLHPLRSYFFALFVAHSPAKVNAPFIMSSS